MGDAALNIPFRPRTPRDNDFDAALVIGNAKTPIGETPPATQSEQVRGVSPHYVLAHCSD